MATTNPRNPDNEPCKQMFIDAINSAQERHIAQNQINILQAALNILNSNPALSNDVNKRWYSHRVPDSSVQYIQSRTLDKCPERFTTLTAEEEHLLSLLERIQDPASGCVMVKKAFIADLCHMSQVETRRIQLRLDRLAELGFIEWLYRPQRGSKTYGIVRVNQRMSWIGSNRHISTVLLNVVNDSKYQQAAEYAVIDDEKIRCGTLVHKEHKKMADAASIDHQGIANPQSQSHDIREHQKNQEKSHSANNMQNEMGMTAEEAALFSQDEQPKNPAYSIHNDTKEE